MIRHSLAIPAGCVLFVCALFLPLCAQTTPNTPQEQVPPTAVNTSPQQKLSDEDLARLYLVRKQYREAQDLFHKLTVEQPKNAVYWNELGISFHNQSELDAALKCYQRSFKLDPKYADAENNVGTVYYAQKKFAKAIRTYKKAISIRDDSAAFYLNLGYAYFNAKDYDQSIASFRKALQIEPEVFDAGKSRTGTVIQDRSVVTDLGRFYYLLAKSFAESGNVERCVIYLRKARDDGHQDLQSVRTDPSFAKVLKDPSVQELLEAKPADTAQANE